MRDFFTPPGNEPRRRVLLRQRAGVDHYEWVWLDENGITDTRCGHLSELAENLGSGDAVQLVVLLSPDYVSLRTVILSESERGHYRQLVPYAVEEELAENTEELHFAYASRQDNKLGVAIIRVSVVADILQLFRDQGLDINVLTPEALSLPWAAEGQTWVLRDAHVVARTGPCAGFVASVRDLGVVATLPGSGGDHRGGPIEWVSEQGEEYPATENYPQLAGRQISHVQVEQLLAWQAQFLDEQPLNLLQGQFSSLLKWRLHWRQWKPVVYVALAALVFNVVALFYNYASGKQQASDLQAEKYALARQVFPRGKIRSPERQMKAAHAQMQAYQPTNFAAILARVGPNLAGKAGYSVRSINYDGNTRTLRLEVRAKKFQQMEQLKKAFEGSQLKAKFNTSARAGEVLARFEIVEAGG